LEKLKDFSDLFSSAGHGYSGTRSRAMLGFMHGQAATAWCPSRCN
jgi:hypothetical protein